MAKPDRIRFHNPERERFLRECVEQGLNDTWIAKAMGTTRHTIRLERLRLGLGQGARKFGNTVSGVQFSLPDAVSDYYVARAVTAGVNPPALIIRVLRVIADDDMLNAILEPVKVME